MCFAHCAHDTYEVKVRVWRSQQRLECANLLALLLAARAGPRRVGLRSRKTAATSRRFPNAGATAKQPRVSTPGLCDALNGYLGQSAGQLNFRMALSLAR